MPRTLNDQSIGVILLDIEGTTTPIDFIYKTLFPFARERATTYLAANWSSNNVQSIVARLREENLEDRRNALSPPPLDALQPDSVSDYVHWLMDKDRKSTPLKELQGVIWEEGYHSGELQSEVFDDVPRAFAGWRKQGKDICIYSSGSVLAQKLLFSRTEAGDLTRFIRDYFDTNIGAKREAESYRRIAESLRTAPSEILFASDVTAELEAAQAARVQTVLCLRPGNAPQPGAENYRAIQSFNELFDPEGE